MHLFTLYYFEQLHDKTCIRDFRPGSPQTRLCSHRRWLEPLEISDLGRRGIVLSGAKTKMLISCAVTRLHNAADLHLCFCICKSRFSVMQLICAVLVLVFQSFLNEKG